MDLLFNLSSKFGIYEDRASQIFNSVKEKLARHFSEITDALSRR